MNNLLVEDISRIKSIMGVINESNISLPIVVKGSYSAKGQKNAGDALHSFEKRKSDGFGGRMSTKIKEKLIELYKEGINPDVTDIKIKVDSNQLFVEWEATIDESTDGKAYVGVSTVGSAGGGADRRAETQIEGMKKWAKGSKDYTLVLDFKNPKGIYIRQYFYKYTKPTEFPPHSSGSSNYVRTEKPKTDIVTPPVVDDTNDNKVDSQQIDGKFNSWSPGEYKLSGDNTWTYNLTSEKEWEAKKGDGQYKNLKDNLSSENYEKALNNLLSAKKIN